MRYVSDKEKILQMVYQNLTCRDDITSEDLEEAIQSLKIAKFEAEIKEKREKSEGNLALFAHLGPSLSTAYILLSLPLKKRTP